ncbi:hypothetical protein SUDANB43_02404 [Streptomyces sp. enrichment culture]
MTTRVVGSSWRALICAAAVSISTSMAAPSPQEYVPSMETGSPPAASSVVVVLTSAEPSSSVRSVARVRAAMIVSALSTALSAVSAAVFAPSEPHAVATTIAAAVNPTQAAVYFSFMSPHPLPCSCDSSVRRTLPSATDSVRIPDDGTFFCPGPYGSRTPQRPVASRGVLLFPDA